MRRAVTVLAGVVALASAGASARAAAAVAPAAADPDAPTLAELDAEAQQAFADGDYAHVIEVAARAYELSGDPSYLYAQGHAERFLGNCDKALALYARVLVLVEDRGSDLEQSARESTRLCEQEIGKADPKPAPVVPTPVRDEPVPERVVVDQAPVEQDEPRPAKRWHRDALGGVLIGVGVAGLAAGTAVLVASSSATRSADSAIDEATYADERSRATTLRWAGASTLAVGGALVVGAITRYAVVAKRLRPQLAVTGNAGWIGVSGRF